MRILLVEHDRDICELLNEVLKTQQYVVDIATNGQSGWGFIEVGNYYDLIILDTTLPIIDGYSLCRQLRTRKYDLPILMTTTKDTCTEKVECFNAGADDCITRPFKLEELLARIRVLVTSPDESRKRTARASQLSSPT
ncbi:MAG: response regulator transcription factor [Pleurocapsa sp. MO_226.B13]|nr:response regulator transcription factor [Pleurocapsa sp. MO_226.B13]